MISSRNFFFESRLFHLRDWHRHIFKFQKDIAPVRTHFLAVLTLWVPYHFCDIFPSSGLNLFFSSFILLFGYRRRITCFIVTPIPGSSSRPGCYFTPVVTLLICGCFLPQLFLIIPRSSFGLSHSFIAIHLSNPPLCHLAIHIHIIVPVLFNS